MRASDPGVLEGNVVFTYLDAFEADAAVGDELKARYRRGALGDTVLMARLTGILQATIAPIRQRRAEIARHPDTVMGILRAGSAKARADRADQARGR